MKICIISTFYPPFYFGGERATQREAETLVQRGHEVTVVTSSPNRKSGTEDINGVSIHRIVPFNLYPPYEFQNKPILNKILFHIVDVLGPFSHQAIKQILKKVNPDVVYINNFKGLSLAVFSAVKGLGLPSVFSVNDYSLICPRANLLRSSGEICNNQPLTCRVYAQTQKYLFTRSQPSMVIANAQFTLDKFKENGFFSGMNLAREVIGVAPVKIKTKKDEVEFNILYIGGITRHKGVHVLINAFIKLKQANVRLHIVGKGSDTDEMKRLAGTDSKITFYGFIPDDELAQLRHSANISVVPSIWYDMAQGVICESYSYGTPVIGSRIGGIPELIEEGYNGLLFEAGNSEQLQAILERLIANPQELKKLEAGAFESSKKYDIEGHVSRLEEIFTALAREN